MAKAKLNDLTDDLTGDSATDVEKVPALADGREYIPFGTPIQKLDVKLSDEFMAKWHPRWVNEVNMFRARQGGYQPVNTDDDGVLSISSAELIGESASKQMRQAVGYTDEGRPLYAYLMKAPRELIERAMEDHENRFNKPVEAQITAGRVVDIAGALDDNRVKTTTSRARPAAKSGE